MAYLMGIDIGTTGCKVMVFDVLGCVKAKAYREYTLYMPSSGARELNPNEVFAAVEACIAECCSGGVGKNIAALSVSAQGEAVIPISKGGEALANSMVSFDTRNVEEIGWIAENLDKEKLAEKTGLPLHTMFSLGKALWIKNHEPQIYADTWKLLCFAGYVAYKLGAPPVMDYSQASRTMMFNVTEQCWDMDIIKLSEIDPAKLPELAPCGEKIGCVSHEKAQQLGLNEDSVIVTGGHDQVCCALGAAVLESGDAMNSMGTTDSIVCVSHRFMTNPAQIAANIPCGSYSLKGLYANHSFVLSTGSVLNWYKNNFFGSEEISYAKLDEETEKLNKPTGLYLLPHFAGSGTPHLDSFSKGILAGLTLETDRNTIYLAILEGICFELKLNMENMEAAGIPIHKLKCIGGAAKSDVYLQLKADILGKPVMKQTVEEAGCMGAALLAGMGVGVISDVKEALPRFVKSEKTFIPDVNRHQQYLASYEKYKCVYELSQKLYGK